MVNIKLNNKQIVPANWNDIQNKPSINVGEGEKSIIEGSETKASGQYSHAQGEKTEASGRVSYAEGYANKASGNGSHVEGERTKAEGADSHAECYWTRAEGHFTHAEGLNSVARGSASHAEGGRYRSPDQTKRDGGPNYAEGDASHVEGSSTHTSNTATAAHAEGYATEAQGEGAHAEGMGLFQEIPPNVNISVSTKKSVATETDKTLTGIIIWNTNENDEYHGDFVQPNEYLKVQDRINTSRYYTIYVTERTGDPNVSNQQKITFIGELDVGTQFKIIGKWIPTIARGTASHAEGSSTIASGDYSHSGGQGTIANGIAQTAIGKYNIADDNSLFIVGKGTSDTDRQNAFRVDENGKAHDATGQLATTTDIETAINNAKLEGSDITIDTELSDSSVNPVQNKVIKTAIDSIANRTNNIETDLQTLNEGSWHILTIEDINGETTTINFWGK